MNQSLKQQFQASIKTEQNKSIPMQNLQNNAVQQRIKRLMKEKKMAKQNQSQASTRKRVTSQTILDDDEKTRIQRKGDQKSIRSEWTRRNTGPHKFWETQNSEATSSETSGQNSRIQVQKIVNQLFSHSPKLAQYLQQYSLKKQDALNQLLGNDLFILSLSSKMLKLTNQSDIKDPSGAAAMSGIVQNEVILKMTKLHRKKKQTISIFTIENKINSLINNRLHLLNKY